MIRFAQFCVGCSLAALLLMGCEHNRVMPEKPTVTFGPKPACITGYSDGATEINPCDSNPKEISVVGPPTVITWASDRLIVAAWECSNGETAQLQIDIVRRSVTGTACEK